ncbi:PD-(D/E)XK nuclease family protein [Nitrosomonas ureae]|uniref:PD-(D/E)XK nuclease superfamily protein n=1 Tax=Nitrosomonas ureae TaxID=44577 RepID=A0A2T5IS25_9PROT|nr:PD-(D/E)XK nuclease family protein [Nitrosomonas ureae]PTQ86623.1 PD-(D/E)XK nuclease superfamily protein [Nitrosomonas ureae]
MQEKINSLLEEVTFKVATLNEASERFADRLAPDFSIFDYLRTDEIGLSRCIADLLNPMGKHGQKEVFLEAFLEKIGWLGNTKVKSVRLEEQANDQRRIDISLKFESGEIIGIENKPWAGDQKNQLSDYASFIEKEAGGENWLLIYLSNNEPSDSSGINKVKEQLKEFKDEKKFVQLDYTSIIEWLEVCACKSKALIVRLFVEELAKFIRMNINGELEMSEENEIKNLILASPQNIESAFHVSLVMKSVKEALLRVFHDDLKEKVEAKDFEFVWDEIMSKRWNGNAGFGVKFSRDQNLYLRFEFGSSGLHNLFWGISRESKFLQKDDELWSKIGEVMNNHFGSGSGRPSERWPWWNWINKKEFDDAYINWDSSEVPWVSIKEGKLAGKIVDLASRVHDAFIKHHSLELLSGKISADMDGGS